jgi:hypothetical protein
LLRHFGGVLPDALIVRNPYETTHFSGAGSISKERPLIRSPAQHRAGQVKWRQIRRVDRDWRSEQAGRQHLGVDASGRRENTRVLMLLLLLLNEWLGYGVGVRELR